MTVLRLRRLGAAFLVALPIAMWLANRSAPLMFGLATLSFVAAALVFEGPQPSLRRLLALLGSPVGLALSAFLLWALLSIGWSNRISGGLAMWGELALPLACGVLLVASGQCLPGRAFMRGLALAMTAAALLMLLELHVGLSERVMLGLGKAVHRTDIFNRPVLTGLLLVPAVLPLLWTAGRAGWRDRALCLLAAIALMAVTLASESGAAKLGLMVLIATCVFARLAPRLALTMVAIGFTLTMATAPLIGEIAERVMPAGLHQRLADSHSRARVDIWLTFGEVIRQHPLVGSGFGATAALDSHPVARFVSEPRKAMLAVGHPHNAPIQTWAETGFIGAALLWFAGLATLARLRGLSASQLAPCLGLFAAAFSIASVGHGAWQGWWIASLALAAALLWLGLSPKGRR